MGKSMLAVIAAMVMAAGPVAAQQQDDTEVKVRAGRTQIQVDPAERDGQTRAQDNRTGQRRGGQQGEGLAVRASELEGMEIRNQQDEDLGEVHDVVIDLQTGRVRYIAMSAGGLLGVGEKLFAIPWGAFRYRMQDEEQFLVLNATKEKFENAPGFDDNAWPNFADRQWRMTNDRFYGDQGFVEQRSVGQGNQRGDDAQRRRQQRDTTQPVQP